MERNASANKKEEIVPITPNFTFPTPTKPDDEAPSHLDISESTDITTPHSSFTPTQKACISYAVFFSAVFSDLSSFIYYPAITALSSSLNVSIEEINLTITSYQLVSGFAPSIFGDMADQTGRRPVSLIALSLYLAANLGLALQDSYKALVLLRCLQSAGASSTLVLMVWLMGKIGGSESDGFEAPSRLRMAL